MSFFDKINTNYMIVDIIKEILMECGWLWHLVNVTWPCVIIMINGHVTVYHYNDTHTIDRDALIIRLW